MLTVNPDCVQVEAFKAGGRWWVYALFCGESFRSVNIGGLRSNSDVPNDPWVKMRCVQRVEREISQMSAHQRLSWAARQEAYLASLREKQGVAS